MKALKFVFWLVIVLLAILFVGAWLLPGQVSLERSIRIERPPAQVFAVLEDLDRFNEWSAWYQHEPEAEYWRTGPQRGPGSTLNWRGKRMGEGALEITRVQPHQAIDTQVRFGGQPEPALASYRLQPAGACDEVTGLSRSGLAGARWFGLLRALHRGGLAPAGA